MQTISFCLRKKKKKKHTGFTRASTHQVRAQKGSTKRLKIQPLSYNIPREAPPTETNIKTKRNKRGMKGEGEREKVMIVCGIAISAAFLLGFARRVSEWVLSPLSL